MKLWSTKAAHVNDCPSEKRTPTRSSSPSPSTWVIRTARSNRACARPVSHGGRTSSRWATSRRHRSRSTSSSTRSSASAANSAVVSRIGTPMKLSTRSARPTVSSSSEPFSRSGFRGVVASITMPASPSRSIGSPLSSASRTSSTSSVSSDVSRRCRASRRASRRACLALRRLRASVMVGTLPALVGEANQRNSWSAGSTSCVRRQYSTLPNGHSTYTPPSAALYQECAIDGCPHINVEISCCSSWL